MDINNLQALDISFYYQPTLDLAKALLGCILIKETDQGITAGIITETEAYIGPGDRAAHSYNNRRTKRTEIMFWEPGYTYTYTMHTHCLFNVVSGKIGKPEAILVRAVEPYLNKDLMVIRRPKAKKEQQLTNGPGKLTKALGITMKDYGHLLTEKPLWIANRRDNDFSISHGPRIGIPNAREATHYPWRFWIKENKFVSR